MKSGVVGGTIGGVQNLGPVLSNFSPLSVLHQFGDDWELLLEEIEEKVKFRSKIKKTARSIWPRYCQTILSGAHFLNQFSSGEDFHQWVRKFDSDSRSRAALPMLISHEIEGYGFALACDFLKEIGYSNYAKPDVHVSEIFKALELCPSKANDYRVFKAVIRLAENVGVTAYNADKLFWLVGSGYFYRHPDIGNKGRIGSRKAKFIELARHEIG
jgi:hypothetical protein